MVFDLPDQNPLDEEFPKYVVHEIWERFEEHMGFLCFRSNTCSVPKAQGRTTHVGVGNEKAQCSKLANGVQIGSVDAGGPVSSRLHKRK